MRVSTRIKAETRARGLTVAELARRLGWYRSNLSAIDAGRRATFVMHGVPIKVGRLPKLLASKKLANRPTDRQFLKRYGEW